MAEEEAKAPEAPQLQEGIVGGLYHDQTCRLCGRVWLRSQGLPPDPACRHTDAEWQTWAAAQQPPVDPNFIIRWDSGVPIPDPPP